MSMGVPRKNETATAQIWRSTGIFSTLIIAMTAPIITPKTAETNTKSSVVGNTLIMGTKNLIM
jgi:hypothetical protein